MPRKIVVLPNVEIRVKSAGIIVAGLSVLIDLMLFFFMTSNYVLIEEIFIRKEFKAGPPLELKEHWARESDNTKHVNGSPKVDPKNVSCEENCTVVHHRLEVDEFNLYFIFGAGGAGLGLILLVTSTLLLRGIADRKKKLLLPWLFGRVMLFLGVLTWGLNWSIDSYRIKRTDQEYARHLRNLQRLTNGLDWESVKSKDRGPNTTGWEYIVQVVFGVGIIVVVCLLLGHSIWTIGTVFYIRRKNIPKEGTEILEGFFSASSSKGELTPLEDSTQVESVQSFQMIQSEKISNQTY